MKKNQSLIKTKILKVVFILVVLGVSIFLIHFWVNRSKEIPSNITETFPTSEVLKPGKIGEPKEGEKPEVELPQVISNTSGTIKEIKKDKIVILGSGSNFADKKPRELTLIFTDSTIVFDLSKKVKYQGLEGLKHLKLEDKIRVSSPENIRGKTEFLVKYINKF